MRDRQLGTRGGDSSASPVATASTRYLSASMKGPPPARTIALCSLLSARLHLAPFPASIAICARIAARRLSICVRIAPCGCRLLACADHTCPYAAVYSHAPFIPVHTPTFRMCRYSRRNGRLAGHEVIIYLSSASSVCCVAPCEVPCTPKPCGVRAFAVV